MGGILVVNNQFDVYSFFSSWLVSNKHMDVLQHSLLFFKRSGRRSYILFLSILNCKKSLCDDVITGWLLGFLEALNANVLIDWFQAGTYILLPIWLTERGEVLSDHYKLLPIDLRDIQKLDGVISLAQLDPR